MNKLVLLAFLSPMLPFILPVVLEVIELFRKRKSPGHGGEPCGAVGKELN